MVATPHTHFKFPPLSHSPVCATPHPMPLHPFWFGTVPHHTPGCPFCPGCSPALPAYPCLPIALLPGACLYILFALLTCASTTRRPPGFIPFPVRIWFTSWLSRIRFGYHTTAHTHTPHVPHGCSSRLFDTAQLHPHLIPTPSPSLPTLDFLVAAASTCTHYYPHLLCFCALYTDASQQKPTGSIPTRTHTAAALHTHHTTLHSTYGLYFLVAGFTIHSSHPAVLPHTSWTHTAPACPSHLAPHPGPLLYPRSCTYRHSMPRFQFRQTCPIPTFPLHCDFPPHHHQHHPILCAHTSYTTHTPHCPTPPQPPHPLHGRPHTQDGQFLFSPTTHCTAPLHCSLPLSHCRWTWPLSCAHFPQHTCPPQSPDPTHTHYLLPPHPTVASSTVSLVRFTLRLCLLLSHFPTHTYLLPHTHTPHTPAALHTHTRHHARAGYTHTLYTPRHTAHGAPHTHRTRTLHTHCARPPHAHGFYAHALFCGLLRCPRTATCLRAWAPRCGLR